MKDLKSNTISFTDEYSDRFEKTELMADDDICLGTAWRRYDTNGNIIYEKYSSYVVKTHLYENNQHVTTYDPSKQGCITAIRIYNDDSNNSMAELAFAFGGTTTIDWCNTRHRDVYAIGINGYTFIFDERPRVSFDKLVK